jgi:hypothetical protein
MTGRTSEEIGERALATRVAARAALEEREWVREMHSNIWMAVPDR